MTRPWAGAARIPRIKTRLTRLARIPILSGVNTFLQILSQLAWGVTVGALIAAAGAAVKLLAIPCAVMGGWAWWRWRKKRSNLKS